MHLKTVCRNHTMALSHVQSISASIPKYFSALLNIQLHISLFIQGHYITTHHSHNHPLTNITPSLISISSPLIPQPTKLTLPRLSTQIASSAGSRTRQRIPLRKLQLSHSSGVLVRTHSPKGRSSMKIRILGDVRAVRPQFTGLPRLITCACITTNGRGCTSRIEVVRAGASCTARGGISTLS